MKDTKRMMVCFTVVLTLVCTTATYANEVLYKQDFDKYKDGASLDGKDDWKVKAKGIEVSREAGYVDNGIHSEEDGLAIVEHTRSMSLSGVPKSPITVLISRLFVC